MHYINSFLQKHIIAVIDFFYPLFKRLMPIQLYRYGVAGVANMCFDWVLYYVFYHYVFHESVVDLGFVAFTPHIASFVFTFPITFISGFWLSRYISFKESVLRGRIQLFRYFSVVLGCIFINYIFLKIFVEVCGFYPTPSKIITTFITTVFSFLMQKYFSFKA
jgi:putative flippase GtrA